MQDIAKQWQSQASLGLESAIESDDSYDKGYLESRNGDFAKTLSDNFGFGAVDFAIQDVNPGGDCFFLSVWDQMVRNPKTLSVIHEVAQRNNLDKTKLNAGILRILAVGAVYVFRDELGNTSARQNLAEMSDAELAEFLETVSRPSVWSTGNGSFEKVQKALCILFQVDLLKFPGLIDGQIQQFLSSNIMKSTSLIEPVIGAPSADKSTTLCIVHSLSHFGSVQLKKPEDIPDVIQKHLAGFEVRPEIRADLSVFERAIKYFVDNHKKSENGSDNELYKSLEQMMLVQAEFSEGVSIEAKVGPASHSKATTEGDLVGEVANYLQFLGPNSNGFKKALAFIRSNLNSFLDTAKDSNNVLGKRGGYIYTKAQLQSINQTLQAMLQSAPHASRPSIANGEANGSDSRATGPVSESKDGTTQPAASNSGARGGALDRSRRRQDKDVACKCSIM